MKRCVERGVTMKESCENARGTRSVTWKKCFYGFSACSVLNICTFVFFISSLHNFFVTSLVMSFVLVSGAVDTDFYATL